MTDFDRLLTDELRALANPEVLRPREPVIPHNPQNAQNSARNRNSADCADSAGEWDAPAPLPDYPVPAFPTAALPPWLKDYVEALATTTQTPPDLAGVLVLAAVAGACARVVEVQVSPDWREPVNLCTVVSLPPGDRKSATLRDVAEPVAAQERRERDEHGKDLPHKESARRVAEARLKAAEQDAAKAEPAARAKAEAALKACTDALRAAEVPPTPRRLVDDATAESLGSLLCQHGRMLCLSPEGGELFALMRGRYSRNGESNFGLYLSAHAGDPIRVDRKGRPPEQAERPAFTLGLAVQPSALAGLMHDAEARGRGLHARFLYAVPPSRMGSRDCNPPPVSNQVRLDYRIGMGELLGRTPPRGADGEIIPHMLTLAPEARAALLAVQEALEPEMAQGGELGHMADWVGKLAGAVVRIAGLLHLTERKSDLTPWARPIARVTMEHAITLGRYFLAHARAAYGAMGADPVLERLRRLLAWLKETREKTFTARGAFNKLRCYDAPDMDALWPALELAEQLGYIGRLPDPERSGAGRKRSPTFAVNPLWLAEGAPPAAQNARNTQNELAVPS